jgi:hypothetical protein
LTHKATDRVPLRTSSPAIGTRWNAVHPIVTSTSRSKQMNNDLPHRDEPALIAAIDQLIAEARDKGLIVRWGTDEQGRQHYIGAQWAPRDPEDDEP